MASLQWYEKGAKKPVDQGELSEGTLRFLWLMAVLTSPNRPQIILLDEPEVSLHPELLMHLAGVLQEAALTSQVIVATHADRLVRWLQPEEIAVMEESDAGSSITWLDRAKLDHWLKDYTIDELWSMGTIGGRP
jgi:predicted ATPase